MDIMQIGVQLLQSKLGSNIQASDIASALSGLLIIHGVRPYN